MTLLELLRLLRFRCRKIVIVSAVCGIVCFAGALVFASIKPSYSASANVVVSGGSFSSVSGTATNIAAQASGDGVSVAAVASTSNSTLTFTGKGSSPDACIKAVNDAANSLAGNALKQQTAATAVVTEADAVTKTGKAPILYVIRDSVRGGVHSPETAAERGLTFLGEVSDDESRMRIVLANFRFSGKDKDVPARTVLLVPAGKGVSVRSTCAGLARHAGETDVKLKVAPALEESVAVLYKGREADSVVVVVEEEISTFSDIDELVREFAIAGITPGGFVYVPYQGKVRG